MKPHLTMHLCSMGGMEGYCIFFIKNRNEAEMQVWPLWIEAKGMCKTGWGGWGTIPVDDSMEVQIQGILVVF